MKEAITEVYPDANVEITSMADGGEGTLDTILLEPTIYSKECYVTVSDPLMNRVTCKYAIVKQMEQDVYVIESAQSSGLSLVPIPLRNAMVTNTYGLGEQILHAIHNGAREIVIYLGGVATNDGGVGMLQALGWEFYDEEDTIILPNDNPLLKVSSFDDKNVPAAVRKCNFTVATDVRNEFYGLNGATHIFGKQKGANEMQMDQLDEKMKRLAELFERKYGIDVQQFRGSGAAGGLGGAIIACLNGYVTSGVDAVISLIGLEEKVKSADVIFTGEGSLDNQTNFGKVPVGVAKLAKKHNKKVIGVAGRIDTNLDELNQYIDAIFSIQTQCRSLEEALQPTITKEQLKTTVGQVVRLL